MDLPEIDVASVEEDSRPGLSAQIGDGTFNGVYRVRAVRGRGSAKNQIDNCCLLRLREDIGVDLAVVKAPHTSRVKDYMVGFASRKTTYEQKIKRILKVWIIFSDFPQQKDDTMQYYRRECTIWARISADSKQAEDNNLLQFYGFLESYDFNQMPAFVAKYYALGDARSYINQNTQPRLSNKQKIYLISDIAKALTFIHSTCGIAHRDVRGSNILLKAKAHRLIGILGDFGSAKEFTIDVPWFLSSSDSGGDNWCPPEYKRPGGFHDDKGPGDIWSLGCTMLELLQEKDPWYQVSLGDIPAKIAAYEHPPKGANILQDHYDFITACWTTEDRRPTADDFQSRVEQLAENCST
ncbi:hypothetical protein ACEPAG_3956 [Sanghuangporus baumii]